MKEHFELFLGETLVHFCLGILNTLSSLCLHIFQKVYACISSSNHPKHDSRLCNVSLGITKYISNQN